MINMNRPKTNKDEHLMDELNQRDQDTVLEWIRNNLYPRKHPLLCRTSYRMKHLMTSATGIYVTNNQFKDAMRQCGYDPIKEQELNWHYCIGILLHSQRIEKDCCFAINTIDTRHLYTKNVRTGG